ncbi:RdRP-domain-containing protein [Mycena pura]|uniref:RNA-dependent RNA polymerase n=1 Tax=Mycena pura TaxID=153505 RepID=A0AAD6YQ97_9AGAR|nr:RdRP-domain-containing protein [Mycena pura]
MQLFMRNIVFSANVEDVKLALAERLHIPPFSTDPLINFQVDLFRQAGTRGNRHRGIGLLTVPSAYIGETFLRLYGSNGVNVKGRPVLFSPNKGTDNKALIETVGKIAWVDPKTARQEKERRARLSGPITLSSFSFGRFCRDGAFSPETTHPGTVACNVDSRQIDITYKGQAQRSDTSSVDGGPLSDTDSSLGHMIRSLRFMLQLSSSGSGSLSIHYPANRIINFVVSELQVFLQSDLPPTFENRKQTLDDVDIDEMADASSLGEDDFRVTSLASQGLCLTFNSPQELETFSTRCRSINVRYIAREVRIEERDIYSAAKLANLQNLLGSLDFGLAFAVDKAVWGGVLEPDEVVAMQDSLEKLRQVADASETAAIFRYFLTTLDVPVVESTPQPKKRNRRRRNRKQQLLDSELESPSVDMRKKLAEAIDGYTAQLYQPKRKYTPSAGVYQSYHLVLTPSTQILEGPLPDRSNSVLRRFKNNECFLRVSFQDENRSPPRRDQALRVSINELLEKRYKKCLLSGVRVAGRSYEFPGYSMSGLKEYSFIFVTPFIFDGLLLNAESIRDRLGDFSKILYQPALLGARWAQAFTTSDPSVTLDVDQIREIDDRVSATGSVFTDGCSSMSVSLSRGVWKTLRSSQKIPHPPSAFQFRCGGAKGVLVQNSDLPDGTLNFRPSQTKFDLAATEIRTLDIAATSARPILTYLNRPLIALLEHHGTPKEAFVTLQEAAIDEVHRMKDSLLQASKVFSQHGLGASFRLPSLFNHLYYQLNLEIRGAWSNPDGFQHRLIKTAVAFATMHILREIKHRAHILIPGSYTLIGVADEWGCLEEGEIYATVVDHRAGINEAVTGRVLITRSPQIHPGDAQFVTAVRKPQLEHLTNVVVFSCKGPRSLPSQLGGGDLDGDIYNLILNETLFPPKNFTAVPGEYAALPTKRTPQPCTVSDVVDFVIDYIKSDLVGIISILHLRIGDLHGFNCEDCLKLAEKASHAVDFQKRGVPVNFNDLPRAPDRRKPDYLSGEGINPAESMGEVYYLSAKVLGELYRNVPIEDYRPTELELQRTDGNTVRAALAFVGLRSLGLPSVNTSVDEDLMEEMRHILDEYSDQLMVIAKTHTTSKRSNVFLSEAELVSGTIQERYGDHRKRREAISAMNLEVSHGTEWVSEETTEGDEEQDEDDWDDWEETAGDEERRRDRFERAWAAWLVAEEAIDDDASAFGASSFGLLALGTMLDVIKEAKNSL